MKDKDFDKIFAHKFGQLPGQPAREEDWAELSVRLDAQRRRRNLLLPLLLPLFGLLAGGNIFWWYQWRRALDSNRPTGNSLVVLKRDTIVQTTTVYRFDTVYEHRYVSLMPFMRNAGRQEMNSRPANPAKNAEMEPATVLAPHAATAGTRLPAPGQPEDTRQEQKQSAWPDSSLSASPPAVQPPEGPVPAIRPSSSIGFKAAAVDSFFEQKTEPTPISKKTKKPLVYLARPRLGMAAAWGVPLIPHRQSGRLWGLGLASEVEVARNLRCAIDVQYWTGRLQSNETEALRGIEIPNPGDEYEIEYWETYRLPAVTYALSLRYQIPVKSPWKPGFGLGVQAATLLPFDLEIDFEKPGQDLELYVPGRSETVTRLQGLLANAGLERALGAHFAWGAEMYLLKHFGRASGFLDNQWGLKTRLFYTF